MKKLIPSIILLLLTQLSVLGQANQFTQTVRGTIIDKQSQAPIDMANIVVVNGEKQMGEVSDAKGYFKFPEVPVGRISIEISYAGYETVFMNNIELSNNKELVLNIEMEESAIRVDEITVSAQKQKGVNNNKMALISTRQFSVEETMKFAGSNGDVSRMATNFAGVRANNDGMNEIVIRGNSPNGLLWRMEGIDIPNPNHFGDGGSTGGPVSMLNNNVLSNSDFMTGAFPAGYGNALSGVFDLRMRTGNNEKHEFLGQVGFNGFEFGAEGPLNKESGASYLINGRYATLEVMSAMGMDFGTGTAIPKYKDVTGHFNFPTKKAGTFSIFGLAGTSDIEFLDSEADTTEAEKKQFYKSYGEDLINGNRMQVIGAKHKMLYNNDSYTHLTLAYTSVINSTTIDTLSEDLSDKTRVYSQDFARNKWIASLFWNKKIDARNSIRIGAQAALRDFDIVDSAFFNDEQVMKPIRSFDGSTYTIQPYVQWQHKATDRLTLSTGVHGFLLGINQQFSIEPRLGINLKTSETSSLSLGYGLHSQMAPINYYKARYYDDFGNYTLPNEDLDFTKSHHVVLGFERFLGANMRFKGETYYQHIFNAVVEHSASPFSVVNRSAFQSEAGLDSLTNGGTGRNYGVELTLEKYLNKGTYFLFTTSLYESKYKGSDGIERSTTFNGNYVLNFLGGKEFNLTKKDDAKTLKKLTVDFKSTFAGGQRYTPIDMEQSRLQQQTVFKEDLAYSEKLDDYMRLDIRVGFKMEGKKTTQEWAADIQNFTNNKNPLNIQYDRSKDEISTTYQLGVFPMFLYRITF